MQQQSLNIRTFIIGCIISLPVAAYLFYITYRLGIKESFLKLNGDGGYAIDQFFRFFTYFGDAILWIPMLAYIIWKKKKLYLPLATGSFALVTILVQVCKYFIVPDEPRPTTFITDGSYIHTVEGVAVHSISSFPSGHTATAFTFFLMICLMSRKSWWLPVGFVTACLVGYSRVYLAQHFPLDVAAGIIVAIVSVSASIPFQRWSDKRNLKVTGEMKA
jgi:membrane-associated phospholipid phosphatase